MWGSANDPLAGGAIVSLGLAVVGAALFALLARRLGQPTLVGFVLAGLVLGPVLGLVAVGPILEAFAEFGVALLLFLVGLDLSLRELRAVGPPAVVAGLGQLLGSAVGGYVLARMLGFEPSVSLFLAVALAFSSTILVVKILVDLGDLSRTYGRLAVGIFLVQDLVVVLLLTLLPVFGGGAPEGLAPLMAEGAFAVGRTFLLVALALGLARLVLPPVFRLSAGQPALLLLLGLAWLFGAVGMSAVLGVSVEVAAFAAGLSIASLPYAPELRRSVHPILDLFLALFFVSLGLRFGLADAAAILPGALLFSAFVLVGNWVVLTLVLGLMGYPRETSFRAGITVGQVSEFSFVLAALALTQGVIGPEARDFVVLVGMITMAASAALIWRSDRVYRFLERFRIVRMMPDGTRSVEPARAPPRDHALLLGWDPVGSTLLRVLRARGGRIVVVDADPDVHALPSDVEGVYADPEDEQAVADAGLADARVVIANLPEPGLVRTLLGRAKGGPPIVARAETDDVARLLLAEGAAAVVAPANLVADAAERALEVDRPGRV